MKDRIQHRKKILEKEAELSYKIKQFFTFQWLFNKQQSAQRKKDSYRMNKFSEATNNDQDLMAILEKQYQLNKVLRQKTEDQETI